MKKLLVVLSVFIFCSSYAKHDKIVAIIYSINKSHSIIYDKDYTNYKKTFKVKTEILKTYPTVNVKLKIVIYKDSPVVQLWNIENINRPYLINSFHVSVVDAVGVLACEGTNMVGQTQNAFINVDSKTKPNKIIVDWYMGNRKDIYDISSTSTITNNQQ
jgi:hypothetical protein